VYHLLLIRFLLAILAIFLFWQGVRYTKHLLLVKRLRSEPFPQSYEAVLNRIPYYKMIPKKYLPVLHYQIRLFIEEKQWEGIYTDVSLQMKVTVAFFACLLTMGNKHSYANLRTILIYPYEYIAKEVENFGGIFHKQKLILEGQSMGDSVIVSWHGGKNQALHLGAHNVIIHEFAHEFDYESGQVNGMPLVDTMLYKEWAQTIYPTFEALNRKTLKNRFLGKYKLFGTYAGKNEAEFFAVATELFFQKPKQLYRQFPKVYKSLQKFYKLNPKEFF